MLQKTVNAVRLVLKTNVWYDNRKRLRAFNFLIAPYEAVRNELRNAGYRGMSATPALARGFIGNLDALASKNLFAVANGNGYLFLLKRGASLPMADKYEDIALFSRKRLKGAMDNFQVRNKSSKNSIIRKVLDKDKYLPFEL
ncbi:MAG: hypothetical protein ACQEW9_09850 [Bacteroidota bacterium]